MSKYKPSLGPSRGLQRPQSAIAAAFAWLAIRPSFAQPAIAGLEDGSSKTAQVGKRKTSASFHNNLRARRLALATALAWLAIRPAYAQQIAPVSGARSPEAEQVSQAALSFSTLLDERKFDEAIATVGRGSQLSTTNAHNSYFWPQVVVRLATSFEKREARGKLSGRRVISIQMRGHPQTGAKNNYIVIVEADAEHAVVVNGVVAKTSQEIVDVFRSAEGRFDASNYNLLF